MSVLTFIRHGQAGMFAEDYDRLSKLGEIQIRRLGAYWAVRERFTTVFVGPRLRQRQSAELVGDEYRRIGIPWPVPVMMDALDEYDLNSLMGRLAPDLSERDQAFQRSVVAFRKRDGEGVRSKGFQPMFELLLRRWQADPSIEGLESWSTFRRRVAGALERVTSSREPKQRVAVFTSGGFIGAAIAEVLGAPDSTALELGWRLRNGALSSVAFTAGRQSLDEFNVLPHLPDPTEWTYR